MDQRDEKSIGEESDRPLEVELYMGSVGLGL